MYCKTLCCESAYQR